MKHLILYYSYTGSTRRLAHELAAQDGSGLCEVKDKTRPGALSAYSKGCIGAMRGQRGEIQPVQQRLEEYDQITVMLPVWAGNPPPAGWSLLDLLPAGKEVAVRMVSASGKSSAAAKVRSQVEKRGCMLLEYTDIKR